MAVVTRDKSAGDKAMNDKTSDKPDKKGAPDAPHADKSKTTPPPPPPAPERVKALGLTMDAIKKQFGEGSIMRLGDSKHTAIEGIPTGALSLDLALGIGGLPRGRIIEIFGPESSGKT